MTIYSKYAKIPTPEAHEADDVPTDTAEMADVIDPKLIHTPMNAAEMTADFNDLPRGVLLSLMGSSAIYRKSSTGFELMTRLTNWFTDTAVVTMADGWSLNSASAKIAGLGVQFNVSFERTGAQIDFPASGSGDIGNVEVCRVIGDFIPTGGSGRPLATGGVGRPLVGVVLPSSGVVQITAISNNMPIETGHNMSLGGFYAL